MPAPDSTPLSRVRRAAWIATILLAVVHARAARYFVNPDGVSYLDLSDDYSAGRLAAAVNGHWSPLYPWLIAQARSLANPGREWESVAVHGLNVIVFLLSLAAFEVLLREMRRTRSSATTNEYALSLDSPAGLACAYALFAWCGLSAIAIREVTPDMIVAGGVYLIAAMMTKIRRSGGAKGTFTLFGLFLGLSYLAKAVMFPVSLLALLVSWIATRKRRGMGRMHILGTGVFVTIATPQVIAVSREVGHPSFGEAGTIVYGLRVNDYPKHWIGDPTGSGTPIHPIQVIARAPTTYSFPLEKASRAFPLWDEPAHWYDGMRLWFNTADQANATGEALLTMLKFLVKLLVPLIVVFLARDGPLDRNHLPVGALAVSVLVMHALLHAEPRLIAPWVVVALLVVLASLRIGSHSKKALTSRVGIYAIVLVCMLSLARQTFAGATSWEGQGVGRLAHTHWRVAKTLERLQIRNGERVVLLGDESDVYWARLGGVQASMHIPLAEAPEYWSLSAAEKDELHARLSSRGAAAIVASWTSPPRPVAGWISVEGTAFSILPLHRATNERGQPLRH